MHDPKGCFLAEPPADLVGRRGSASYKQGGKSDDSTQSSSSSSSPSSISSQSDFSSSDQSSSSSGGTPGCQWNVDNLCCDPSICLP